MTRIDFYLLAGSGDNARSLLACRITEKAFKQGHQVYISTETNAELPQLDDMLWTFRPGSFLPHSICCDRQAAPDPILLGHHCEPGDSNDVLVNLSHEVPHFFSRFNRVAELVDDDNTRRAAARERYRFYKDRGYRLTTHEVQLR